MLDQVFLLMYSSQGLYQGNILRWAVLNNGL